MNTKKTALRIALALASITALAVLFPVLAMVLLGLLTLVLPLLLVLSPVLVLLPVVFLIHLARGKRESADETIAHPVGMGAAALQTSAR